MVRFHPGEPQAGPLLSLRNQDQRRWFDSFRAARISRRTAQSLQNEHEQPFETDAFVRAAPHRSDILFSYRCTVPVES